MRTLFIILALVAVVSYAYDPVFIDELKDIVPDKNDKKELKKLDKDKDMIRSEKKQKLDVILARQTDSIKKLFEIEVQRTLLKHQMKMEKKMAVDDPAVREYWQKVEEINKDMSISQRQADKKIKELKEKLTPEQRRLLKKH
ncbi:unnamed protein product [Cylicocyclus nassatus]|uniref:Uncharacterized protein n=1 Tax=Cylicocyclus nassatus TaxID=53992 RepID=A0AA36ME02_CYLNA|nr:unnamed protein product [Cylicocyclus nassatus]